MKLTGARWSAACRCPRWGAYTALNIEAAEPTIEQREYMTRGQWFERIIVEQLRAKHGQENVLAQVPLEWDCGVGHADALITTENLLVEVFSTVAPRGYAVDDKILQARGYLTFAERAGIDVSGGGVLILIDPSKLRAAERWPVTLTDTENEVGALEAQIRRAVETSGQELPDCSKLTPGGCRWSGCPYTEQAWAGWEPPVLDNLPATPELLEDLEAWTFAKHAEADLTRRAKSCKEQRKTVERRLAAEYGLPVGKFHVAGYQVRRTIQKGKETYAWSRAVKAGAVPAEAYDALVAFLSVGDGSERWTVERSGEPAGAMADVDYGAVPF